jgi:hypothetical protein
VVDNVTLNAGSGGAVVAADDVSSVFYQRVKLTPGGDGAAAYGTTNYSYLAAASANQDQQHPKASAGVLYGLTVTNSNTAARYIKLYNLASGATSASTVWRRYMIPAGGGIREQFPYGVVFDTGLGLRLTTGAADNDAAAVAAAEIMVNLEYV